jgi:hypothetical protein
VLLEEAEGVGISEVLELRSEDSRFEIGLDIIERK